MKLPFLLFQEALTSFHKSIIDFYFSRLFIDKSMRQEDYSNLPVFEAPEIEDRWGTIWLGLGKIKLIYVIVFGIGYVRMK